MYSITLIVPNKSIILSDHPQAISLICLCIPEIQHQYFLTNAFPVSISIPDLFALLKKDKQIFKLQDKINLLAENKENDFKVVDLVNLVSGIKIRPKFSSSISVRVGRPKKPQNVR